MRLDKYLKVSRLIKRRTVANEVADAGRILINGKVAKASQAVKAGDIIEVTFGNRPIKVKVLSDVEPRTKDVAREMYEIIEQDSVLAAAGGGREPALLIVFAVIGQIGLGDHAQHLAAAQHHGAVEQGVAVADRRTDHGDDARLVRHL